MSDCRMCRDGTPDGWLDFGPQALGNRFLRSPAEDEFLHPCRFGVCRRCGTAQLASPVPLAEMRPRFDWITYNEPEGHLDEVARVLAALPGLAPGAAVGGLTYKDESTLKRLTALGLPNTWLADARADLGVESPFGGIESIQDRLTVATADRLAAKFGRPDLLLVRHVLEHAYDVHELLRSARSLVKPGGYVLFEVPDACKALDRFDYTTVWEEHLFYFTPATLRRCLAAAGFEVVYLNRFDYPQEDVLVAVARPAAAPAPVELPPAELAAELARADRFVREFPRVRDGVRATVAGYTRGGGAVAMLGAGHLSAAYVNLYGLEPAVAFVADDNPNKHGLFMPGSRAPILPSAELGRGDVALCLMTVRAEIEDAVARKNRAFVDRGGVLASVFPGSKIALGAAAAARDSGRAA